MKKVTAVCIFMLCSGLIFSQESISRKKDLKVEMKNIAVAEQYDSSGNRTGIMLYIQKKADMESVMLVETTKDPEGKQDNYAYRASQWNSYNGDEIRYLDGRELKSEYGKYSLISSTPVNHPRLGQSFRIFIPNDLEYGYPWTRHGSITVGKGTFINIRTFSAKYADYRGEFMDNPFMFDFTATKKTTLHDDYNSLAALKFEEIAKEGNGIITYSKGPETLKEDLLAAVKVMEAESAVDIVFAIDTTGSMQDDLETLKTEWIPAFTEQLKKFKDVRIGLLFYRDYNDNYNYKGLPVKPFAFTGSIDQFKKCLGTAVIRGNEGGDVPEAVYEALYSGIEYFDWRKNASKKIILIGDAEPHPKPRGPKKISQEKVISLAKDRNIVLDCIIVPDDKDKR